MVFDPRQQSFNAPFVPSNIWPGRGRANSAYRRIKRSGFRKRKALAAGFSAKNDDIVLSFVVPAANTPSIRSESEILSYRLPYLIVRVIRYILNQSYLMHFRGLASSLSVRLFTPICRSIDPKKWADCRNQSGKDAFNMPVHCMRLTDSDIS